MLQMKILRTQIECALNLAKIRQQVSDSSWLCPTFFSTYNYFTMNPNNVSSLDYMSFGKVKIESKQ